MVAQRVAGDGRGIADEQAISAGGGDLGRAAALIEGAGIIERDGGGVDGAALEVVGEDRAVAESKGPGKCSASLREGGGRKCAVGVVERPRSEIDGAGAERPAALVEGAGVVNVDEGGGEASP